MLSPERSVVSEVKKRAITVLVALLLATLTAYTVNEAGPSVASDARGQVTMTVNPTPDPERSVTIPITPSNRGTTTDADYSGDRSVTFTKAQTARNITFTATGDSDDGDSVVSGFGTLPAQVESGSPKTATVSINDKDDPEVTVSFASSAYPVNEGSTVSVTVSLNADPERSVTIPLTKTNQGTTTNADYSGVPANVAFASGETSKSFTFSATEDSVDDDGESVKVGFGTLPTGVTAGTINSTTVSITDKDHPQLTVSYEASKYTVRESDDNTGRVQKNKLTIGIYLSADPERAITIPLTITNQGGASIADYSVDRSVTFASGRTSRTLIFTATADNIADDDESVLLGFGTTLPQGVTAGGNATTTVTIKENPALTVWFDSVEYRVAEGETENIRIYMNPQPEEPVTIPILPRNFDLTTDGHYSVGTSVTFNNTETNVFDQNNVGFKTITFTTTQNEMDDGLNDSRTVRLRFGDLPEDISQGDTNTTKVVLLDDEHTPVTVSFGETGYQVQESDDPSTTYESENEVTITVSLDKTTDREVTIPLTATNQGGASTADYQGVPENVTFGINDKTKNFTITAVADTVDDDDESILLGFGTLPELVSAGSPNSATVSIRDDDDPAVTVEFEEDSYTVAESDDTGTTPNKENEVTITVNLSADPERTVEIPLTTTNQDGATNSDYSGVPESVTFATGDTSKTFAFKAAADTVDDDDEKVNISFGTLPARVSEGTNGETTVSINDDDDPEVTARFGAATHTVAESDDSATTDTKENEVTITVTLSADPERSVTIPLTATNQGGASSADYSVDTSVAFASGDTSKTITFTAKEDTADDDDESVQLTFGTLPDRVTQHATDNTIAINDDDDPAVTVRFGAASYSVDESDDTSTSPAKENQVTISVNLSADPERSVTIPLTKTNQGGTTSADYSGVPDSVAFASGDTSETFTITAKADSDDDDGESVVLGFGTMPLLVRAGAPKETTVSIKDDDDPAVTVQFGAATYSVNEGSTVSINVSLDADPERDVTIPLSTANNGGATAADYSVPSSITFAPGETSKPATFTAKADTVDDDDESVTLTFGTLPDGVSEGDNNDTTVSINDDDDPRINVSFATSAHTVAEGGQATVTVRLSADPERSVTIPLTNNHRGGASSADYSVASSVAFAATETSKTFAFIAINDTVDDDGESVILGFGTMPEGVSQGATGETTVSIRDDDDPEVRVQFGAAEYIVQEGRGITIHLSLDKQPERNITIPVTATNQGGADTDDYSGAPTSVTFNPTETRRSFIFTAESDNEDDDNESVMLQFGTLPNRVSQGATARTTVAIEDTDDPVSEDRNIHPPNIIEEKATNDSITLTWRRDHRFFPITGYTIWRSLSPRNHEIIEPFIPTRHRWNDNIRPESYADTDVLPGTDYYYKIYTVSYGETSKGAGKAWVTTQAELPSNIRFRTTHNRVTLTWDKPDDGTITGYRILRSVNWGTESLRASSVSATATSYVDTGVSPETAYSYRVQALRGGHTGPASRYILVLTKARPRASTSISEHAGQDLPAGTSTKGLLKIGDTVSGVISPHDDLDSFAVDVKEGVDYFIRLRYPGEQNNGHGPVRIACVRDSQGERYDRSPGPDTLCPGPSQEVFNGTRDERIYIEVGAAWAEHTPGLPIKYTLEIHPDNGVSGSLLQVSQAEGAGKWTPGSFHDQDRGDRYEIELCGGWRYRIPVFYNKQPNTNGHLWYPKAFLHNTTGTDFAYNYAGIYVVRPNGTGKKLYHLELHREPYTNPPVQADPVSYGEGQYRFLVELVDTGAGLDELTPVSEPSNGDLPHSRDTTGLVPFGKKASGNIESAHDVDWFMVRFDDRVCNGTYRIKVEGTGTKAGTLDAPNIEGLYNAAGIRLLAPVDEGGTGKNAQFEFAAPRPGPYFLAVGGSDGSTGTYTIEIETVAAPQTAQQNTPENSPPTGSPRITGSPSVGQSLSVDTKGIADPDGLQGVTFTRQWMSGAADIPGATGSTYTIKAADAGRTLRVRVEFTDNAGNSETLTSMATNTVSDPNALAVRTAAVHGKALTLTYNATLNGGMTLPATAFSVSVNSASRSPAAASVSDRTVTLTLSTAVSQGDVVTVSYSLPPGPHFIRDTQGRTASSFTNQAVTNNTPAPTLLTAAISGGPAFHNGRNEFAFRLRFSDEPELSYQDLRDHAFTVTNGTVTKAKRMNASSNIRWLIHIKPSASADITVTLPVTTDCAHRGAVCTRDGRKMSTPAELRFPPYRSGSRPGNNPATAIPTIDGTPQVGSTLRTVTNNIADDDGLRKSTFSFQWTANGTEIDGAAGPAYTLVPADEGKTIMVRVSFTDDRGHQETLTSAATGVVAAAPSPLTASVHSQPVSHDGSAAFTFELRFSETPKDGFSYKTLRDHAFMVTGGVVTKARRLEPDKNIWWEITVQPSGNGEVAVNLPATTDCDDEGAICTDDGRMLSSSLEFTVPGPGG